MTGPRPDGLAEVSGPIADVLVLCMTRGMSLTAWTESGVIEREWALYKLIAGRYGRIVVVSYGGRGEADMARGLLADVVCNDSESSAEQFARELPGRVLAAIRARGAGSAIVKTNQFEGGGAAVAITRALREADIRTTLIARGGYPWSRFEARKYGPDSEHAARAAAEEGDLCRSADLVIGTTRSMLEDLAWRYQLPNDRFRTVPNYIVAAAAPRGPSTAPPGLPVILAAGRLEPQKRFDAVIRAVSASGRAASVIVRIVGRGPLRDELIDLAHREGVALELIPGLAHAALLEEMRNCTLFVQCSAFEGHPKTVLEAMGAGACVIVTDDPGLADTVSHGQTGFRAMDHGGALAAAIGQLLGDPERRRMLGDAAHKFASRTFAVETIARHELAAHTDAVRASAVGHGARATIGPVRWDPSLLGAERAEQTEAWRASINGFVRRLPPGQRAAFLLSLDDPINRLQSPAAIEHDGSLDGRTAASIADFACIRLLVLDFDGVMSNNQVLVLQDGTEGVLCNRSDGMGLEMLRKRGVAAMVISKEVNPVVAARCRKLKLECHQGVDDKLPTLQKLANEKELTREQIAYVGNDINDLECMGWVGLPIAVADAYPQCIAAARLTTGARGGWGAVREVCDRLIAALAQG